MRTVSKYWAVLFFGKWRSHSLSPLLFAFWILNFWYTLLLLVRNLLLLLYGIILWLVILLCRCVISGQRCSWLITLLLLRYGQLFNYWLRCLFALVTWSLWKSRRPASIWTRLFLSLLFPYIDVSFSILLFMFVCQLTVLFICHVWLNNVCLL